MNGKCGECSADLEPVVWVQGGTFGYIDKHSNRNFRILPYCNTPPLLFRNIITVSMFSLTSMTITWSVETETRRNLKKWKKTSSNGERKNVEKGGDKGKRVILVTL